MDVLRFTLLTMFTLLTLLDAAYLDLLRPMGLGQISPQAFTTVSELLEGVTCSKLGSWNLSSWNFYCFTVLLFILFKLLDI